jgi:hypothetical protein
MRREVCSAVVGGWLAMVASTALAEEQPPLQLLLSLDTAEPCLGMPIFGEIGIRNGGTTAATFRWCPSPVLDRARGDAEFAAIAYEDVLDGIGPGEATLKPGETVWSGAGLVFWMKERESRGEARAFLFPEAGAWRLRARLPMRMKKGEAYESATLTSAVVAITVRPAGPGFEDFSRLVLKSVYGDGSMDDEATEKVARFLGEHPDGECAAFFKYAALKRWHHAAEFEDVLAEALRSERVDQYARSILKEVGKDRGEMSESALYALVFTNYAKAAKGDRGEREGCRKEGDKILSEFKAHFPRSWLLKEAVGVPKRLEGVDQRPRP